jgi:hypothetical protein
VDSAQRAAENASQYDLVKDPKRRLAKSKDPGWKYAFRSDLDDKYKPQCTLCGKIVPSGVSRFKKDLPGDLSIVEKCPKATPEIRKRSFMKFGNPVHRSLKLWTLMVANKKMLKEIRV